MIDYGRAARARDRQVEATKRTTASSNAAAAPLARSGGGAGGSRPTERNQNHSVAELEGLQLRYQPTWLLTMIGGNQAMESYCQASDAPIRLKPAFFKGE